MKEIIGPQYQYQAEHLSQNEVLFVRDHHYNEQDRCFYIKPLVDASGGNNTIIFDHVLQHDDILKDYNLNFFPSFMARECAEFSEQNIEIDWTNKCHTFNFMINKPRPHREFLLKLVAELDLTNYCHSLAWKENPINHIPVTDFKLGTEQVLQRGIKSGNIKNAKTYQGLLQKTVFEPTCVSLITEPAFYEKETIVTEKTIMAVYAGTLPIWVGGWRIPDCMKSLGFDIFEDLVDHSYQNLSDPFERCRQAVLKNFDLLNNFEIALVANVNCHARFTHNLQLLKDNVFLHICLQRLKQFNPTLQTDLEKILRLTRYK